MAFRFSKSPSLTRSLVLTCVPLLGLGACAYDDGYGYGGMSVGTGYYDGYGDSYYGPAGYYGGWYNDFYYPGNGYYVFDRGGKRYRWNDRQRAYWEGRRQQYRNNDGRGNDGRDYDGRGDGDRGDRWRGRDRREGDAGRAVDSRRTYDRRTDRAPDARTPDATPGRNGQGRNWQNRPNDQGRNWRPENRPAPSAGQGYRGNQAAQPERVRPTPSVRQSTPRGADPRPRTQPE